MANTYIVIHPVTHNSSTPYETYEQAYNEATMLSQQYGVGVEIRRQPKEYKHREMVIAI